VIIEGISPYVLELGPLTIRWYGLMFAISILTGFYYMRKHGVKKGFDEDTIFALFLVTIFSLVLGARAVFVLVNWSFFMANPELIIRVDQGGLAFHGGLLGGIIGSWIYCRQKKLSWFDLADLAVPGIAIGIALVRIANIFNQEIIGREAELFFFDRQPTQVYGSLIGLALLLLHNYLARRGESKPGYLFWSFVLGYTLLRALIEETFRENPLVAWGYINDAWGAGFFTLTHLATPFILLFAFWMLKRISQDFSS